MTDPRPNVKGEGGKKSKKTPIIPIPFFFIFFSPPLDISGKVGYNKAKRLDY